MADLQSNIKNVIAAISGRGMKPTYLEAAHVLLDEFRATAPVGQAPHDKHPGQFRDSAFVAPGTSDAENALFLIDFEKAPYAHVVEYGNATHAPHGTIRKAMAAVQGRIPDVIGDGLMKAIDKATGS